MPYRNGVEIKREGKLARYPGATHVRVVVNGQRRAVEVKHVSRETLDRGPSTESGVNLGRREHGRPRRKRRMRLRKLRKLRGWR